MSALSLGVHEPVKSGWPSAFLVQMRLEDQPKPFDEVAFWDGGALVREGGPESLQGRRDCINQDPSWDATAAGLAQPRGSARATSLCQLMEFNLYWKSSGRLIISLGGTV